MLNTSTTNGQWCAFCQSPPCQDKAHRRCGGCRGVRYCSVECQTKDWEEHRPLCRSFDWIEVRKSQSIASATANEGFQKNQKTVEAMVKSKFEEAGMFERAANSCFVLTLTREAHTPKRAEYAYSSEVVEFSEAFALIGDDEYVRFMFNVQVARVRQSWRTGENPLHSFAFIRFIDRTMTKPAFGAIPVKLVRLS